MRLRLATLLLLALPFVAACGGTGTAGSGAADVVPASAFVYADVDSDLDSSQWEQARELIDRFPGAGELVADLQRELAKENVDYERDVEPAVGDEVAIAVFDTQDPEENFVLLTKPDDDAKLRELLDKVFDGDPYVTRELEGWTIVAEQVATLDRFERASEQATLASSDAFERAVEKLPGERLATIYVSGTGLVEVIRQLPGVPSAQLGTVGLDRLESVAGALEAQDDGAALVFSARINDLEEPSSEGSELAEKIPGDAIALLSIRSGSVSTTQSLTPEQRRQAEQFLRMFGVDPSLLEDVFTGSFAAYVRPTAGIPEVTVLAEAKDEAKARALIDRLERLLTPFGASAPRDLEVAGIDAKQIEIQNFQITYAVFDGLVAITTSLQGLAALRESDERLADAEDYRDALEAAGATDDAPYTIYVNVADALPLLSVASFAGVDVPPDVEANLRPIRSIVGWAETEDGAASFTLFVQIQ